MIILSCVVYGMAFDFFNISGSLFVEGNTDAKTRSSAQGLFMMMTNGVGAVLGSVISGWAIEMYFTKSYTTAAQVAAHLQTDVASIGEFLTRKGITVTDGILSAPVYMKDWPNIWLAFAIYAAIIAVAFAFMFKHKHNPDEVANISH